jgi:hypothetical protein
VQEQVQVQEQEQAAAWGRRLNMNQGPQMMRRLPVSVFSHHHIEVLRILIYLITDDD